jgi:hypothetical protein
VGSMGSKAGSTEDIETTESLRPRSGSSLLTSIASVLDEVEDALGRLEDGSYGLCELCGGPIEVVALSSRPTTRRCAAHVPSPTPLADPGSVSGFGSGPKWAPQVEPGGCTAADSDRGRDLGSEHSSASEHSPASERDRGPGSVEELRDDPPMGLSPTPRAGLASDEGEW